MNPVLILGAGLAGCEAAWQLAKRKIPVLLTDMKPRKLSPAHHNPNFAELVCSNSLKAQRADSAAGLLKQEMRLFGSLSLQCADECQVPAGGALAVDREKFASLITEKIKANPYISLECREASDILSDKLCIIATGPLTSEPLSSEIARLCGGALSFYDAAAPIVTAESIDQTHAFSASRYGKGGDDYINCPMNKEEYEAFHEALIHAETAPLKEFDQTPGVYEGCMPIETLAKRGTDAIRFGPLKPVGLRDPATGHRPWAVLQLRQETAAGELYNLVGFQTNLKFPEQKRVFGMIPALRGAEYVRYGVMHRNTFIDSPRLLNAGYQMKNQPNLFFAGQITGVEGYMESAASGILAGINVYRQMNGQPLLLLPPETMTGALASYISDESATDFQPMGANFGILPPLIPHIRDKKTRYQALSDRALQILAQIHP